MKIGSIVCLVVGLVFFGVAATQFGQTDKGPVLTDEQIEAKSKAIRVIHDAQNPGATVDPQEVQAAHAAREEAEREAERQAASRQMMKRIFQGLGGVALLAGIIMYVLDKRNE